MELVVATRNKHKLREIVRILHEKRIVAVGLDAFIDAPAVIEDGHTFAANAAKKALTISRHTGRLTIADDSGLSVDALDGAPGVFSARYAGEGATDAQNNEKLLAALADVPKSRRAAQFVCCVALADARGLVGVVEGRCRGSIGFAAKGGQGFGYDPLFMVPRLGNRTFAELDAEMKNNISHRAKAFAKAGRLIRQYLKNAPPPGFGQ